MIKLTVLYNQPDSTTAFEAYYAATHLSLVNKMSGYLKVEYTVFLAAPDGTLPEFYRMAEFWFVNMEALQATMGSPEGQAAAGDIPNFASGGFKILIGTVN